MKLATMLTSANYKFRPSKGEVILEHFIRKLHTARFFRTFLLSTAVVSAAQSYKCFYTVKVCAKITSSIVQRKQEKISKLTS